jgi:hypothetical protein
MKVVLVHGALVFDGAYPMLSRLELLARVLPEAAATPDS